MIEIVPLTLEHLIHLPTPDGVDPRAYFIPGSVAECVIVDGVPVFAGGLVNLQWHRAEAWIIPTPFLHSNLRWCLSLMSERIRQMADDQGFTRVQAVCPSGISNHLFRHLGFSFEGTLRSFGPHGETCDMFALISEAR